MADESESEEPGLVLNPPLGRSEGRRGDLRVPTVALAAEVFCADGRQFPGRIFLPSSASHHAGVMRAEEWMNEPNEFFPLLPDGGEIPVILNKREILVISVPASADRDEALEDVPMRERRLTVECSALRLTGTILIDMPEEHSRVLDYLNRPGPFLTLREGDRHFLVCKARITRVLEIRKE